MPYYRHLKDTTVDPFEMVGYDSMRDARDGIDPKLETVTFVASPDETCIWQAREQRRLDDGIYVPVPWSVSVYPERRPDATRYHYAHLSLKSPGLVAYTKHDEHGVNDRQTVVKPGKYLAEFYAGQFMEVTVQRYIAECGATAQTFKLATSEADITAIFGRTDCGFSSCMQSKASPEYTWDKAFQRGDRQHPCVAYADSDLAIAYLGDIATKITARVVVWPHKKRINLRSDGTLYGDQTLLHILKAAGYTPGSIIGARLRRVYNGIGTLMPYVDNIDSASKSDCGKWILLDNAGLLCCSNHHSGYGERGTVDEIDDDVDQDPEDDNESDIYTCEHCHSDYAYADTQNGELNHQWCDGCIDTSGQCARCESRSWYPMTQINGSTGSTYWCGNCVDDNSVDCATDGCEESWLEQALTAAERTTRQSLHISHLCVTCATDKQACIDCAQLFDVTAQQCECGRTVRCRQTMLLTLEADLPVAADGSLWWRSRIDPTGYWVWDGSSHHTSGVSSNFRLSWSDFTPARMDAMVAYYRVPDPRPVYSIAAAIARNSEGIPF